MSRNTNIWSVLAWVWCFVGFALAVTIGVFFAPMPEWKAILVVAAIGVPWFLVLGWIWMKQKVI